MVAVIEGLEAMLTLIPELEQGDFGAWTDTGDHVGTSEDPMPMPHIEYSPAVEKKLIDGIYAIDEANPELGIHDYAGVLEANGLEWSDESLRAADVSTLDAQCVLAMVLATVRADRFAEGILLRYLEEGVITGWLKRLRELMSW